MNDNARQVALIRELFAAAERRGLPLWLESGWAIDARLGRITRPHDDIDIAYPHDREADYFDLIASFGYCEREELDYGFLSRSGGILLDSEPCFRQGGEYGFVGFPPRSCPPAAEGCLEGIPVRCVSWEAMYFEVLEYMAEIPSEQWRPKDFDSLRHIEAHVDEESQRRLKQLRQSLPA